MSTDTGIVVIGRNEGERLRRCLDSAMNLGVPVVYADSMSADASPELARSMGAEVVELDGSRPTTAGLGRNEGFERLMKDSPGVRFVQFVDGDCEVRPGWLEAGREALETMPGVAVVCGRLREREPEASVYNRLCDMEWRRPVGEVETCGGVAMIRVSAFEQVNRFDPTVIAGQDDELYLRLRRAGWRLHSLGADMALHDSAMLTFRHWWRRAARSGHAFAEGAAMHGNSPERHWVRQARSVWAWGLGVPMAAGAAAGALGPWGLLLLAVYPLQAFRIAWRCRRNGDSTGDALLYAAFCMLAKPAQLSGTLRYHWNRLHRRQTPVFEHKLGTDAEPRPEPTAER